MRAQIVSDAFSIFPLMYFPTSVPVLMRPWLGEYCVVVYLFLCTKLIPKLSLLSILYGLFFTLIFNYADRYNSDMKWLLRGITIAWILPLLRGGDLPGIVAWLGMSYWPVFWILIQYNKHLKQLGFSKNANG